MDYDRNKVDEVILALMYLTTSENARGVRALRAFAHEHLARLEDKALINGANTSSKSVTLTTLGEELSIRYFRKHFIGRLHVRVGSRRAV